MTLPWDGGQEHALAMATGAALWQRTGEPPLSIRWVLLRCPQQSLPLAALFRTDQAASPARIVAWFVGRWNSEVTFGEILRCADPALRSG